MEKRVKLVPMVAGLQDDPQQSPQAGTAIPL